MNLPEFSTIYLNLLKFTWIYLILPKGEQGTAELGGKHSFETDKWTMFLETEASFPYCNWSIKMAGIIWLGSTSVHHVNNWHRLSRLPFLSLCKSRKFLETKTYFFISIKKKTICKKKSKKFGWNMVCFSICRKLSSIFLPLRGAQTRKTPCMLQFYGDFKSWLASKFHY